MFSGFLTEEKEGEKGREKGMKEKGLLSHLFSLKNSP